MTTFQVRVAIPMLYKFKREEYFLYPCVIFCFISPDVVDQNIPVKVQTASAKFVNQAKVTNLQHKIINHNLSHHKKLDL